MISSTWNFSSNFGPRRRATATFCKAITRAETIQLLEKSRVADGRGAHALSVTGVLAYNDRNATA